MSRRYVALLGRRDSPTDAVEEYCKYLATALVEHGIEMQVVRVAWAEKGWKEALAELRKSAGTDPNGWYLLQYTALAWSRRGFSWRALRVVRLLKRSGARVAVVFHDVQPYFGHRIVDRLRRTVQLSTMRKASSLSDLSIFTIPGEKIPWAAGSLAKAAFIPVGANLPAPERAWVKPGTDPAKPPTVGLFSVSSGPDAEEEAKLISDVLSEVTKELGAVRLQVMGRNSEAAERILLKYLSGIPVKLTVHGMLSGEDVVSALASCDAMVFLRGPISSRRGSAIAGIACGLPVIARAGWETAVPITEAGVVLLPSAATHEFGPALLRVLADPEYRAGLAQRSRDAQRQHFSWPAIAAKYAKILHAQDR